MRQHVRTTIFNLLHPLLQRLEVTDQDLVEPQATPSPDKGDFSINTAMKLAKRAKCSPLVLANEIRDLLSADRDWFARIEVAPPGFVNIFLENAAIARVLREYAEKPDLGLTAASAPGQRVVIDYSSVNIAKEMHVGHLRSTIIGDVLARVLTATGNTVIRQNHLGDWGLPIAMVLWKAKPIFAQHPDDSEDNEVLRLADLDRLYREAVAAQSNDPAAAATCHQILGRLQNEDPELIAAWQRLTRLSMREVYRIYRRLGVLLQRQDERGESFYRDRLQSTVEELVTGGFTSESQGAVCVFLEQFKSKDGAPLPVIVRKSDGAYNYATFDLAAIRYRIFDLAAERLIYVTDARQALHFAQLFSVAEVCGWRQHAGRNIVCEHVPFGAILGENQKPLKTREGGNVKLAELLEEAVAKALEVVRDKNPALHDERKLEVARAVGIGAVKYADLSQNRNNDYVFSFERMLALNGNTAPYLQYAHARICSIFRKGDVNAADLPLTPRLNHPAERALALRLVNFPAAVQQVAQDLRPHGLCNYLFDLAVTFSAFYDACPVLHGNDEETRVSRLAICHSTRRTLALGLELLGIKAPEEM